MTDIFSQTSIYTSATNPFAFASERVEALRDFGMQRVEMFASPASDLLALNYISILQPKQIVFFEQNKVFLDFLKFTIELIRISDSQDDFISRFFLRSLPLFLQQTPADESETFKQKDYLKAPVDREFAEESLKYLSNEGKQIFNELIAPLVGANSSYTGAIVPSWPTTDQVPTTIKTFFYGFGWLESFPTFNQLQTILSSASIRYALLDIRNEQLSHIIPLDGDSILNVANCDDLLPHIISPQIDSLKNLAATKHKLLGILSYKAGINIYQLEAADILYFKVSPHLTPKSIIIDDANDSVFRGCPGARHSIESFNDYHEPADTIVINRLISKGLPRAKYLMLLSKAFKQSKMAIIIEPELRSKEWAEQSNSFFTTKQEMRELIRIAAGSESKVSSFNYTRGSVDAKATMIYLVEPHSQTSLANDKVILNPIQKRKGINVCMIFDLAGWAWWHQEFHTKRNITDNINIDIRHQSEPINHEDYDYIVLFESYLYHEMPYAHTIPRNKIILGCCAPVNLEDAIALYNELDCRAFVVLSEELFNRCTGLKNVYCCQNGVDTNLFCFKYPRSQGLSACWVGNPESCFRKAEDVKGFKLIRKACSLANIPLNYLAFDNSQLLAQYQLRDEIYHRSSFYICASLIEGTPNPGLESLSCGLPVISTRVGNMLELIRDGYNGFFIERSVESIIAAIDKIRHADLAAMSMNARQSIENGWSWQDKAVNYTNMFRKLIEEDKA